jgi:intracellular sulfur oxidation DsrE/DsrF family protein
MKHIALASGIGLALAAVAAFSSMNQAKKHRIVIDVATADAEAWSGILTNVANLRASFGAQQCSIEVVAYGKALGLLLRSNAALQERMANLAAGGVSFAACENTMRRAGVGKEELLPFASTVDSGVAQLVRRQESGWSYLKPGQ